MSVKLQGNSLSVPLRLRGPVAKKRMDKNTLSGFLVMLQSNRSKTHTLNMMKVKSSVFVACVTIKHMHALQRHSSDTKCTSPVLELRTLDFGSD